MTKSDVYAGLFVVVFGLAVVSALVYMDLSPAYSPSLCRQGVVEKYGSEVQPVPGRKFTFIARKSNGEVWYVQCNSHTSTKITDETLLFGPTVQK